MVGQAQAGFEGVGCFAGTGSEPCKPVAEEQFGEEVQLGGVGGLAVNYTGAGGVPAGTVYSAGYLDGGLQIAMYVPKLGGLEFRLRWEVTELEESYERCGPALPAQCKPRVKSGEGFVDVDVDQTTGNVYAFNGAILVAGRKMIVEYKPDGSAVITRFGELAPAGVPTAATSDKIHSSSTPPGGIAVNGDGDVYVYDINNFDNFYHRLMKFRPKPPKFDEYEYASGEDVGAGGKDDGRGPQQPVADAAGRIYVAPEQSHIEAYDPTNPEAPPICSFDFAIGGITGITVIPLSGEVFFFSYKLPKRVYELGPCNEATGKFEGDGGEELVDEFGVKPERGDLWALAFDPIAKFSPTRTAGVLYGGAPLPVPGLGPGEPGQSSLGYIFAPAEEVPPSVESESIRRASETSAQLRALINPKGSKTRYAFQYIDESAYQANEPNERQSVTVRGGGGLFGLGFEGPHFGGPAMGTLISGSKTVTALRTATATATLNAAKGTGTLNGAQGKGTLISGSNTITSVAVSEGEFEKGQGIRGEGIPAGATITAVATEPSLSTKEITISALPTKSVAHTTITSGTTKITSLSTGEGAFEAGQMISGSGIPPGTTIESASPTELNLSKPAFAPGAGVTLEAGSTQLSSVATGIGSFEVGYPVQGEGIPTNTKVIAVAPGELRLSNPVTKPGSGVAVSSPGPLPLAADQEIEGPGIAPGTTIASIGAGQLTLSAPATASGTNISLKGGLSADAGAGALRRALEGISTIGPHGVEVSGGPGDESGSSPYKVTFTGMLENLDVPELTATNLSLTGGPATIVTAILNDGGGGFDAGALEAPPGGGELANRTGPQNVGTTLTGLIPGTDYRYRVVATSHCAPGEPEMICEDEGATEAFHTYPSEAPGLHDNRNYELVSPAPKNGGQVLPADPRISSCGPEAECKPGALYEHFPMLSTPGGDAIVYEGTGFAPGSGATIENEYLARRDPGSGWRTVNLTPPLLQSKGGQGYKGFDVELTAGVLIQSHPALNPEAPPEFENLYSQPAANPLELRPLVVREPEHRPASGSGSFEVRYTGATANFSSIVFEANDVLTAEVPTIAPEPEEGGASKFNIYEWEAASRQLRLVNVFPGNTSTEAGAQIGVASTNAVSADGSRIFWSDPSGQVYVREDAAVTKEIPDTGKFLSAARDGSKVLLTNGHLYDLETGLTTDLTGGKGPAGFKGIAGQSADLSHVYFVDTEVLTEEKEENSEGAKAQAGQPNLYAWEEGTGSRYVATLLAADNEGTNLTHSRTWSPLPSSRTAEASPSGTYLAFLSAAPLTGFDNTGPCESDHAGGLLPAPCPEVFVYDAGSGALACASCNPIGSQPLGFSTLRLIAGPSSLLQPRYLTDAGRLYFDSQDTLSLFDTNDGTEDVYEFRPEGAASCAREGGCRKLISAGRADHDSNLLAIDETGKNVFFTSRDRLVAADGDELFDLYDAREGSSPPPISGHQEDELPLQVPPFEPTPASPTINTQEITPCKKGQVRKHGKCVKKHKPRKKRSPKRGGAK